MMAHRRLRMFSGFSMCIGWITLSFFVSSPISGGSIRQAQTDLGAMLAAGLQANDSRRYTDAIQACEKGFAEAQKQGNKEYSARFLYQLGYANEKIGNYNIARSVYARSLAFYPKPPQIRHILLEYNKTFFHLGVTYAGLS